MEALLWYDRHTFSSPWHKFLDIGNRKLLALFGDVDYAAAIDTGVTIICLPKSCIYSEFSSDQTMRRL